MHFLQGHLDREIVKSCKGSRKQSVSGSDYLCGLLIVWYLWGESIYFIADSRCRSIGDGSQLSEDMLRNLFWYYFLFFI